MRENGAAIHIIYNVENGRKQAGKIPPAPGRKLVISYFAVVTSVTVFAMVENTL